MMKSVPHDQGRPPVVAVCSVLVPALIVATGAAYAQLPPSPSDDRPGASAVPRLYVAQRVHDLGVILEGDKHTITWHLENHGEADLVIERARASCGCVVAALREEDKRIPPGGSLDLQAEFDSRGRRGPQHKVVTVVSNDPVEPKLSLEFNADLQFLYFIQPPGMVNLRAVRRGETAVATIDVLPGAGRKQVDIREVSVPPGTPVSLMVDPLGVKGGGKRIRVTIGKDAALGTLTAQATLHLDVDGIERTRTISMRAEVVGALTWHPRIVDQTRHASRPGKRLAPVKVRSTDNVAFAVLAADAGPLFDADVERNVKTHGQTDYAITLTLRSDAPPGPFGTTLRVETDCMEQPVIRVPVFGVVAAPVEVDPPVILLRNDGTPFGMRRRVKLKASPQTKLEVTDLSCDNPAVSVTIDRIASERYHHIRILDVRLLPGHKNTPGEASSSVVTVTTNVAGAERLEIPVRIDAAG